MAAEVKLSLAERLHLGGWRRVDRTMWRHAALFFPWPFWFAVRLQIEAEQGKNELVHRLVRGDSQ